MRAGYLIDTDWIIDHFNRVERTTRKLKELRPAGIAMSVISLAELYEGVIYSRDPGRRQEALETFLQEIPVLGVDQEICKAFGKERGRLRQQRKTVSDSTFSSPRPACATNWPCSTITGGTTK